MNKVKSSMMNLVALVVLALFAANAAQKKRTLVYHSTLDSAASVTSPAVGSVGTCTTTAAFMEGKSGNALYIPDSTSPVMIPFENGLPQEKGCIEYWAKIQPSSISISTGAWPRFYCFNETGTQNTPISFLQLSSASGWEGGGFCCWQGNATVESHAYGAAYSYLKLFGEGESYLDWHHYEIVWNVNGLADDAESIVAVKLDGNIVAKRALADVDIDQFRTNMGKPSELYFPLQDGFSTYSRVPYLIDEFKVWDSDVIGGEEPEPDPGTDPDPALDDGVDVIDGVTWYYTLADGNATIIKGEIAYAGDITTPTTLDGHPVKAIGENAFRASPDLVSVVVSDGVETVGRGAFAANPLLVSVTLPDSVTFIDVDGFSDSTKLSQVNLPPHITKLSVYTFHATAITEVAIPEGVTTIDHDAFLQCANLETVTLPSTLKFIDWSGFQRASALKRIEFPEGFERFGCLSAYADELHAAFGNCTSLAEAIFNGPLPANFTYSWLDKLGCKIWYPKAYEESWAGAVPAEKFGGYTEDYGKEPEPEPEPEEIEFKTIADGGYDIGVAIEPVAVTYNGGAANAKIALAGLPNGLAFKNGAISGVPTMPGFYTVKATVAVGKKTVAERSVKMRVKNYTDPLAEGLPDDLGEFIPGVSVDITLESVKGWKAVTLPAGLKFAPSTGCITGAPTKPGVFTVCFTKTYGYAVHAASSTMTVLPLRRLVVAKEGSGTVKGAGRYLANAKVKLTATPAKKMAVEGWYKDGVRVSRNAAYTYTMTADDEQTLVAKFVSVAEDRKSLTCTVSDGATIASSKYITVTNYQGVAFSMPIAFSALTKPTVSVKGLPKGLKYAGGEIKGASTVASKKDKKGRYVATATTFTLKTLAGNSAKYSVRFVTLPRPAWAVGTYDGAYNSEDALAGRSTLSVAATGAVSGKVFARIGGAGVTATLAAASIKAYDEARGVFLVEATMKGAGIEACKVEFTLAKGENGLGEAVAAADGDAMWLVQNVWKRTALKAPVFNTKKPLSLRLANGLALKFGANGAVTFSGKVAGDDGEPVAVSGSAQLIACWDEESGTNAKLVVYAAPRANLANGVAEEIELHLKKNAKNVVTGVTEVTAAPALP